MMQNVRCNKTKDTEQHNPNYYTTSKQTDLHRSSETHHYSLNVINQSTIANVNHIQEQQASYHDNFKHHPRSNFPFEKKHNTHAILNICFLANPIIQLKTHASNKPLNVVVDTSCLSTASSIAARSKNFSRMTSPLPK